MINKEKNIIYIFIDHINGELQEVLERYTTNYEIANELLEKGYIVIKINLEENKVKEMSEV